MLIVKKEENMKNLHYLKKFVVMVMAAMMTLSTFALPTFAAGGDATITGVEDGASVKAYQFITQDDSKKWYPAGWLGATNVKAGETFTVKDPYNGDEAVFSIQSQDYNKKALSIIANIARKKIADKEADAPTPVTFTGNEANGYKGNLANKGAYVVLVDPEAGKTTVYMPAMISRNLEADEPQLQITDEAVIKKETPEPDKNIITKQDAEDKSYGKGHKGGNANENNGDDSKKGDTLAAGEITQFEVSSPVPAYSQDYFFTEGTKDVYPMFRVSDTLTNLTLKVDNNDNKFEVMSVDASGKKIKDVTYVIVENGAETNKKATDLNNGKSFCIRITDKNFLKEGGNLSVRYWATLDADAQSGLGDVNNNHVKVEYSTKPGQESGFTEKDIDTYHHTFDIDGEVAGNKEGKEFIKVGAIGDKKIISEKVTKATEKLDGAVFELRQGNKVVAVAESDTNGLLKAIPSNSENFDTYVKDGVKNGLTKLDAGEYTLVEVVAPEGYALNNTAIPVSIKATVDDATGKLLSYSVTINGDTNTYTWVNEATGFTTKYTYKDANGNTVGTDDPAVANASWSTQFENSSVGTLPSTGGMGTVLFTVGGVAIMALALFLLFGGKKKEHQK